MSQDKSKLNNQLTGDEVIPVSAAPSDEDVLDKGPYVDGFTKRTILGALFVAFIMMPGSIYLGLVAGQSMGPAAEWVTIILFAELSRRSFTHLKRQEIFILFYVASALAAVALAHLALAGGPFAATIWNQYLLQSPETKDLANKLPDWVVPPLSSDGIQKRNLAHVDWWWSQSKGFFSPMILIILGQIIGRMGWFGMGYIVFRLTSDREKLPFPLAPIAAEGATALAESTDRDEGYLERRKRSWRWNVFSIGASLGIVFGLVYILLPVGSGLFMAKPIMLLPIPFVDFTSSVENFLPASLVSISFDAGIFLAGMILPFPLVIGSAMAAFLTSLVFNPILQSYGFFKHWRAGNGLLVNQLILSFDFWLSVAIGMALAVLVIGLYSIIKSFVAKGKMVPEMVLNQQPKQVGPDEPPYRTPSKERGDFPIWIAVLLFIFATGFYSWLCHVLVPGFPVWIILAFGFIWTPIHSYISARLIGMTGTGLGTPFLKETSFILSGYKGLDIWFAPIPMADHGGMAQKFRELELTRTRFTSIVKAELLMIPISLIASFLFWWLFWHMSQVPSASFPFTQRVWPVAARNFYLIVTANSSDQSLLLEAIKFPLISSAFGVGMVLYLVLWVFGLPVTFFYGMIGGLGAPTHAAIAMFLGAMFGRYYFRKKFGEQLWARYIPVIAAGFACGMGLSGMLAVACAIISQCTRELPF